jgi:DNA-binding Lrp family transcriptional regulator
MYKLDLVEKQILRILQEDSTITIKEMAKALNLSTTPVFDRIKRMEKAGVIKGYVAIVDGKSIGKSLIVFINISINKHGRNAINEFVDAITAFPEVQECHHISGDADFLLKLVMEDIEAYNQFILDKLSVLPNIGKVESRFSLSERKSTNAVVLD